jgi:hypothetical protein
VNLELKNRNCAVANPFVAMMKNLNQRTKGKTITVPIPDLQQLVLMDLAYLHARHLKWEDKEPCHFNGATARSSDDDEPAPATSAPQPAEEFDFMKWDLTEINSIPWDQLSLSLTG